ncbi:MAG: nicotinate-nucleotide adenylyltransferase [Gammaproteobacteria bacterium]|jgi:nicotinate-nucleotide adenylyltransferase
MIGILGGTFDPVHYGHLRPALEIQQALDLDEVRLLPSHVPPHRSQPHATPQQRLVMLHAAVADDPAFTVDTREFGREGPSYTFDTLQSLRAELAADGLCLLIGMDAFREFTSWHRWREILDYSHLVVMTRPGMSVPEQGEMADFISLHRVADAATLKSRTSGLLLFQPVTQLEISSTGIRQLLASGKRADFLLPESVLEIIYSEGLYGTERAHDG